jgi:acyl-[acyl-carrier-protein]-phospholipid O-acyltransferase/long-chain-fatty-acid--[acyl-carrier-protein] ligase
VAEAEREVVERREAADLPLAWEFVRRARRHPSRLAAADSSGRSLTHRELLAAAVGLAGALGRLWRDEEFAGICLPPSVGGILTNLAASLLGKPAVNLNYTASQESLERTLEECRIRNVVSSRAFLEKSERRIPGVVHAVEDIVGGVGRLARAWAAARAWLLPEAALRRSLEALGGRPVRHPDLATVIFSSGSTGDPKGVMQTHANIRSNIESVSRLFDLGPHHRLLGVLPFFHSTGYTFGLWAPLLTGMAVVCHANPLDARTIGKLIERHELTILFATPTFLQTYARRCGAGELRSLRLAVAGAEKLTPTVASLFAERFHVEPLEGYGCTETGPLIAVSVPPRPGLGPREGGVRRGSVGRPLPGVSVRIVHPESGEDLASGVEGMVLVKGPNVMKGYLHHPELTAQAIPDGWYRTGDMGILDADGFLTITGRLARFAKIGGELVPHLKVEEALLGALGLPDECCLAVTSVPDPKKGERLAVIHTLEEARLGELIEKLPGLGLPNLWLPRRDDFVRVDAIPLLGTGKLDLRRVGAIARERL